jgi:VCBS repeat-containing protein
LNERDPGKAKAGRRELETLTTRTGGTSYFAANAQEIESMALKAARTIRNQYTIGYAPLDQAFDGAYRAIRVTVSGDRHYVVWAKAGYRAISTEP